MQQSQGQGPSQIHDRSDLLGTPSVLAGYDPGGDYCELLHSTDSQKVIERLAGLDIAALKARAARAEAELYNLGITFTVYSEESRIDRILPFDVIPRILSRAEWDQVERGVVQRVTALNRLL